MKNYTGHEYDQVIGQYYAKNRMYNPANRRFTQIDPIKNGYNWYAYVGNNPVNYIDPLGYKQLLPLSIIEKFGGTVTYRNEKDEFGDTIYKAVAVLGEKKETFYVYPNKKYYKGKSHCNEMYGSKMKVPVGEINALLGDAFIDTNQYRQVISILLGVNPLTGTYKDAQEALTGQDIITGKNLSGFERAFAVAAIINPFGGKEQVKIVADMGDDIFIELVFDVGKVADNPELADAFLDVVKKYGSNADYDELVDILKKYGAYADELAEGAGKLSGKWTTVNESMSDASRAYQRQITGTDEVWLQNGVKYDGMSNGTLVEVKGSYANFVDKNTGTFKDWFTGQQGLIDQANRQLSASEGAAINWYFSDTASMNATKSLFSENRIKGINFIYQPIK